MTDRPYFLSEPSHAADELNALDWSSNPLGEPDTWPIALKTAVQMMLSSHFPKAIVWGPAFTTLYNDAFRPILGEKAGCMGKPFNVIWEEAWSSIGPIAEQAYSGVATFIEDYPLLINRRGYPEQCYFTFCYSPIRDETGKVGGMMDTVIETTGKVEAEAKSAVLNAELAHRIKNTFGMVQAIASQTFKGNTGRDEVQSFEKRLMALSLAHDVLIQGDRKKGLIKSLIHSIAAGLSVEDRIEAIGPPVMLGPRAALSVSLLMHELMTNAVKYGSLSSELGRVVVHWDIDAASADVKLSLSWREQGGPPAEVPKSRGFGSKLIKMGLMGTGDVETHYGPEGFAAVMTASLKQLQRAD